MADFRQFERGQRGFAGRLDNNRTTDRDRWSELVHNEIQGKIVRADCQNGSERHSSDKRCEIPRSGMDVERKPFPAETDRLLCGIFTRDLRSSDLAARPPRPGGTSSSSSSPNPSPSLSLE